MVRSQLLSVRATIAGCASTLALATFLASGASGACGGSSEQAAGPAADGGAEASAEMGSINAEFRLPSGSASTASYRLTGPNGFSQASMLDFQGSQAIGFLIDNVPAGSGYALSFTASAGDGGESCTASTSVEVMAQKTASVDLTATCAGGPYVPSGYGTIDTWVSLPAGISLATAHCTLTGPAGIEVDAPITVSGSSGLHFGLQQVPAGPAQVLVVTATATNGETCQAPKAVDVVANQTTQATLPLQCQRTAAGGDP